MCRGVVWTNCLIIKTTHQDARGEAIMCPCHVDDQLWSCRVEWKVSYEHYKSTAHSHPSPTKGIKATCMMGSRCENTVNSIASILDLLSEVYSVDLSDACNWGVSRDVIFWVSPCKPSRLWKFTHLKSVYVQIISLFSEKWFWSHMYKHRHACTYVHTNQYWE